MIQGQNPRITNCSYNCETIGSIFRELYVSVFDGWANGGKQISYEEVSLGAPKENKRGDS